jgi:hypothetical protein
LKETGKMVFNMVWEKRNINPKIKNLSPFFLIKENMLKAKNKERELLFILITLNMREISTMNSLKELEHSSGLIKEPM